MTAKGHRRRVYREHAVFDGRLNACSIYAADKNRLQIGFVSRELRLGGNFDVTLSLTAREVEELVVINSTAHQLRLRIERLQKKLADMEKAVSGQTKL